MRPYIQKDASDNSATVQHLRDKKYKRPDLTLQSLLNESGERALIDRMESLVTASGVADVVSLEHDGLVWHVPGDVKDALGEIESTCNNVAPVSHKPYMNFGEALDRLKKKYPYGDWISCDSDWRLRTAHAWSVGGDIP